MPEEPLHSDPGDGENTEGETAEMEREAEKDSEGTNGTDSAETCSRGGSKRSKQEADLVMADVFSLEEQLLRARSVEVESKLRHYRLSKTCLAGSAALLSEQWRILSNQTSKPKSDTVPSSLSCYPPPSSTECSDTPGFNLSLLGYPLAPGLLSYLNPALSIPTASTATTTAHAQISPLPFLGSSTQLAHTQRHSDRPLIPPHLYYPFLCEHGFGASSATSSETGKMMKPAAVSLSAPSFPSKLNLWKVPALRPNQSSPAAWLSHACSSPEPSHGVKERLRSREGKSGWQQDASAEQSLKRTATSLDSRGAPVEKKAAFEFSLDSLKNSHRTGRLPVHR